MTTYQSVVLSGGGSKGPFALGVLLALDKYHLERQKTVTKIYCGTSVGALNATIAAQGDLSKLKKLYETITTQDILGTSKSQVSKWDLFWMEKREPFHYFKNSAIKKTIEDNVDFSALADSHLLICATNYSTGDLETFYISKLVDDFIEKDKKTKPDDQRLVKYQRINSQEELVNALLASTAIPFYFPPVKIGKHFFVDGGVGNNTPLRQAAYVSRFLAARSDVSLEPTLCVTNDPSRFTIADSQYLDMFGVIGRTLDIFHTELMRDSHVTWERINEVARLSKERENLLSSLVMAESALPTERKTELLHKIIEMLRSTNAAVPKLDLPLLVVQPNSALVEDILQFEPLKATKMRQQGAEKFLELLKVKGMITHKNFVRWNEEIE